jgi:membrane protease YdiL (CAAX protease family)
MMMAKNPDRYAYLNQLFSGTHPVIKLFFVVFIILTSFLLFSFVSILLAIPIFHIPLNEIEVLLNGNLQQTNISLLKFIQMSQSMALFVIPSIILRYLFFNNSSGFIIDRGFSFGLLIVLIFIVMLFSIPIIEQLAKWNHAIKFPSGMAGIKEKIIQLEDDASMLTDKLLSGNKWGDIIINMLMIAIIPAIGEEFLFRGVLQKIFYEWTKNAHLAIFICAILFSTVHMQFLGFVPRMLLGVLFGYLFYWSRNIWIAVAAHFFNNAIAVILNFLEVTNSSFLPGLLENKSSPDMAHLFLSVLIVATAIYLIRKKCLVKYNKLKL